MTFSVTKTWSAGETVTYTDLNQNFSDIESRVGGGIKNADLSSTAAITASKIADRYTMVKTVLPIVPVSAVSTVDADSNKQLQETTQFLVPGAATLMARHEIICNPTQEGFLFALHAYVVDVTISGSYYPELSFYLNGTLIGQNIVLDTDDAHYKLHANVPFTNPLLSITNGDVIDVKLSAQSASTGTKLRGLTVTLYEKWALSS